MADFKPIICNPNELYVPEQECSDCDKLEAKIDALTLRVEALETLLSGMELVDISMVSQNDTYVLTTVGTVSTGGQSE